MIRSSFEPELCCWITRCTVRGCDAHVTGRTPDELHDEACALGWTVRHGRAPLCPEHREYTAPPRSAGVEWPSVRWFCTKLWADDLRKRGVLVARDSKLHTLCELFGVPNDGEHRALADVVRMARVYKMLRMLEGDAARAWADDGATEGAA